MHTIQPARLAAPEIYTYDQQVVATRAIQGEGGVVVAEGEVGHVTRVGMWLKRTYVYAVHFAACGHTIVCHGTDLARCPRPALSA